jgi:hypothetical protein
MYKHAVSTFVFFQNRIYFCCVCLDISFCFMILNPLLTHYTPAPFQSQSYCLMKKDVFDIWNSSRMSAVYRIISSNIEHLSHARYTLKLERSQKCVHCCAMHSDILNKHNVIISPPLFINFGTARIPSSLSSPPCFTMFKLTSPSFPMNVIG